MLKEIGIKDRLKAVEIYAKIKGLMNDTNINMNIIVPQIIDSI